VTGKPVELGGSLGRREATGRGCMIVTQEALKHVGLPLAGARVVVQGFGNVGSVAAELLQRAGCTIVGISDVSGALHDAKGLDVPDVVAWRQEHRYVSGYPKADAITNDELLALDCDVLVPAALENVITARNADSIRAKVIVEGANGPTAAGADEILERKGVFVVPDILANSSGVTTSYFEWVQDRYGYFWTEKEVNERLEAKMCEAFNAVLQTALKYKVDMRTAAYIVAIGRVATVTRMRGMYA
jgi:glutamate dehydrogenase (NAD(P)+)